MKSDAPQATAWTLIFISVIGNCLLSETAHAAKKRVELQQGVEETGPSRKQKTLKVRGQRVSAAKMIVRFLDESGKEIKAIELANKKEEIKSPFKTPYDRAFKETHQSARLSDSGDYVGIIESVWAAAASPESEGPVIESSRIFRYMDNGGNILWERNNVGEQFSLSSDGKRVGLIEFEPLSLRELSEHQEPRHSWAVIYDERGTQIYRFDPGTDKQMSFVGLSPNGRFATADRVCLDLEGKRSHAIEHKGSGVASIDNDGKCRVQKYLREHDASGKQKIRTEYEYKF